MLLMMAEVLQLAAWPRRFPTARSSAFLAYHQTHVDWAGCSLHDLIQPSFSFLVGVALPYSIARRVAEGAHARTGCSAMRSGGRSVLIALGIFLRSMRQPPDQLHVRGHAHPDRPRLPVPVPAGVPVRRARSGWRSALILVGYWLAWALYPVPGPGFDYQAVGVPADWPHHYTGLAAHWNKNAQPRAGVRPVVPQSVPARVAVCRQRRRLSHAQLHPDARRR